MFTTLLSMGVTKIDPIKYELSLKDSFKIRAKKTIVDGITYLDGSLMMDVDLDICYYNRQKSSSIFGRKIRRQNFKIST